MSMYTTGEIAKLTGVSVRTVQYYDSRGILIPSELSEGGRRLYSEADVKRMKIICFLRDAGISKNSIGELLSGDDPAPVIETLLDQQQTLLDEELKEKKQQLQKIEGLRAGLRDAADNFSIESIGDIAYRMENKKKMKRLYTVLLCVGIPNTLFQWTALIIWITTGIWWPFAIWIPVDIIIATWASGYYMDRVAYICPQCHEIFVPRKREALFAKHTPTLRKLTCTCCGHHDFCIETARCEKEKNKE